MLGLAGAAAAAAARRGKDAEVAPHEEDAPVVEFPVADPPVEEPPVEEPPVEAPSVEEPPVEAPPDDDPPPEPPEEVSASVTDIVDDLIFRYPDEDVRIEDATVVEDH